jgi:gliding motility-associated-like protein
MEPYAGYGCPSTLFSQLKDSLTITADAGKDVVACFGDDLQIGSIPRQGLVYSWTPEEGLSDPTVANPFVKQGITNKYVVTTTNSGGGCRSTDTVQVISSAINNSIQLIGKDAYCFGHGDSSVLQVKPEHDIKWFKDGIPLTANLNNTTFRVKESGTYYAVFTDLLGCSMTSIKKPITVDYDQPGITYPLKYAIKNAPLTLSARPIGQSVLWSPAVNLDKPESFTPVFKGDQEQLYRILITSKGGCKTTDIQSVKIIDHVEIYVPTAFTPNNDGRNDYLHPIFKGVAEVRSFRIYNRRGQVIFESRTELPGWDGNFKGSPQEQQAVVWVLECVGVDGVVYSQKGTTVLIR